MFLCSEVCFQVRKYFHCCWALINYTTKETKQYRKSTLYFRKQSFLNSFPNNKVLWSVFERNYYSRMFTIRLMKVWNKLILVSYAN